MGIFSWFRRKPADDDFDKILEELDNSIRDREENLAYIRTREAKTTLYLVIYSSLAYLIYVGLWWFGLLDAVLARHPTGGGDSDGDLLARILTTTPVGLVPILIFFTRGTVKKWYKRKQERENKELMALRKRQREQIDKLKKLSNYDKITEMLERHGQAGARTAMPMPGGLSGVGTPVRSGATGSPFSTPVSSSARGAQQQQPGTARMTPAQIQAHQAAAAGGGGGPGSVARGQQVGQKKAFPAPPGPLRHIHQAPPGTPPGTPPTTVRGAGNQPPMTPAQIQEWQMQQQGLNLQPSGYDGPPPPKGFMDRLAEALLGGDVENSPASKYALICQRCFAHNGLVMKEEMMDIQFICPKCGAFNPSRRARMTGAASEQLERDKDGASSSSSENSSAAGASEGVQEASEGTRTSGNKLFTRAANSKDRSSPLVESFTLSEEDEEEEEEAEDSIIKETPPVKAEPRKANLRQRSQRGSSRSKGSSSSSSTDEMALDEEGVSLE